MQYLDFERKKKRFVIKDTLTQETKYEIPPSLMDFNDNRKEQVQRFKWIDSSKFEIIN